MKDKKLQVFVSSTYTDLKEERQAAVEAILSSGNIPAGMELFSAGDESQMTVIERWIDESDVYLLILGGRYGSVDKKSGKSYIQMEYEYALKKEKPLFSIVISQSALDQKIKTMGILAIEEDNPTQLKTFKEAVLNALVKFWDDKKDIKIAIHETLSDLNYRKELVGWIRGDKEINTGFLAEEIARLTKENSELREKINTENHDNALYLGMTYNQLEKLLDRDFVEWEGNEITLFDYLLFEGKHFTTGIDVGIIDKKITDALLRFKLIQLAPTSEGIRGYKFTNDGHNFYLKAILMNDSFE